MNKPDEQAVKGADLPSRSLQESLDVYSNYAKHIIINERNLEFNETMRDLSRMLGRRIWQAKALDEFRITSKVASFPNRF